MFILFRGAVLLKGLSHLIKDDDHDSKDDLLEEIECPTFDKLLQEQGSKYEHSWGSILRLRLFSLM